MKYSALGGLLVVATLTIQCSSSLTGTTEPAETPGMPPTLVQTPTSPPTGLELVTSTPPPLESTETPRPSSTPSQTPAAIETVSPIATPAQAPAEGDAQLKMVLIRAKSQLEVKQLRQMGINIIRIRTIESKETPDSKEALLEGEFTIEAVVPSGILAKLKRLGFEVTVVP